MYDSTTAADIPADAPMVAGYVDGIYRWSQADWDRFPNSVKVRVAISAASNDGHVLDVEAGAASPDQTPGWLRMRRAAGVDPSVYVNRSNWSAVINAILAAGEPEPHYWLAKYDGIAEVPPGTVAKQYANQALTGQHYDLSAVADVWPGVDVALQPPLFPAPGVPATPPSALGSVRYATWNAAQQLFRIKQEGTLVQAVNDGAGHWAQFELGVGYVPGSLELQVLAGTQLHLWALNPNGQVAHFWQDAGSAIWNHEEIPNA